MTETAGSIWLYLKGRNQPSSWVCIWVCVCAPAQGTKPRAPQRDIMTLRLFTKPQALLCFHLSLEEVILLLSWISEGQPCLCSVGGQEWAPGFPTHLPLLWREINMHRAAHTLVYSSSSCTEKQCREVLSPSALLDNCVILTPLSAFDWEHKAQPCSVSWTGIRCRVTVLGQVSGTGP